MIGAFIKCNNIESCNFLFKFIPVLDIKKSFRKLQKIEDKPISQYIKKLYKLSFFCVFPSDQFVKNILEFTFVTCHIIAIIIIVIEIIYPPSNIIN